MLVEETEMRVVKIAWETKELSEEALAMMRLVEQR